MLIKKPAAGNQKPVAGSREKNLKKFKKCLFTNKKG